MVILIVLVILWTSYLVTALRRAQRARTADPTHPPQEHSFLAGPAETETASQDGPSWSALDDRQLTRLLADSAPRPPPNRTLP